MKSLLLFVLTLILVKLFLPGLFGVLIHIVGTLLTFIDRAMNAALASARL